MTHEHTHTCAHTELYDWRVRMKRVEGEERDGRGVESENFLCDGSLMCEIKL